MQRPPTMNHQPLFNNSRLRDWATPFTIGAFLLTALTGILLFFKINLGLVKPAHEWLSWLLIFGTAGHLALNWRPLVYSLSRPVGKTIFFVFIVLTCASAFPLSEGKKRQHPAFSIAESLAQAPLSTVVQVAHRNREETMAVFSGAGIRLAGGEQTIQEIADENGRRPLDVLALLFQDNKG